jgi:ketosteroid isomerase-like protein
MTSSIAIVQSMYASFAKGDVPALLAQLRPDVEWDRDAIDHGIPWLRPRKGPAEVAEFFASLAALEFTRFEPFAFFEGPEGVVSLCRVAFVVKATGKTFQDVEAHLWAFDREGRVARFRHFADTHGILLAAQA